MTLRVLAAGDEFVLPSLLRDALTRELGDDIDVRELAFPWPTEPFGPVAEVDEATGTEQQVIDALGDAEVCVMHQAPLTERVLASCRTLRLACIGRGGPVNANLDAATARGVAVCNAPGRNATATAEHTLALILAAVRQVPQRQAELLAGDWRSDYYRYDQVGPELENSIVGLVGYGAIGSRVARMLAGFGANVLVHDPYVDRVTLPDAAEAVGSLDELLSRSRIITLHARLTPETRGLIGADQIAHLPDGAILVNAARGALLDYDALCDALEVGKLFAAALDVYPEEPLPAGARLRKAPRTVLTPHLAGASKQTAQKAASSVAAEVGRYVRGEPLQHCVNPEVLRGH
ncbi:MAG: 2-hydroxyacid dehydrogenase [Streptosporangiales bacterium]